jgi:lipid-A-disaccharide synthase
LKYFIIAGEASGDLHGANLMQELKQLDAQAEFKFLGGDLMQAQGGTMVKHYRDMAFMGIVAVLANLRTILRNMEECKQSLAEYQADVLILIDYPGFNLRIAQFAKENFSFPVYYYISPKIWAWKEYRIKSIKKYIDKMFTILPFETEYYKKHNFEVQYVGNPSVDSIAYRPNKDESFESFTTRNNLSSKPIIALLAGSRRQEIKGCLPKMVSMAAYYPDYQFVVAAAPGIDASFYEKITRGTEVKTIYGATYDVLQQSYAAIVNSGTATLETGLFKVPQVVVYQLAGWIITNILQAIVLKIKYVALVNLIADKELAKELLGAFFTRKSLRRELDKIINDQAYRQTQLKDYEQVIKTLGEPGAAKHTAEKMWGYLNRHAIS